MLRAIFFVSCLALLLPSAALADDSVAVLEVSADEHACLDRGDLVDRVAARLGRDPFVDEAALRFQVESTATGRTWDVVLRMLDGTGAVLGTREWESRRCNSALRTEVALSLTLLIRDAPSVEPSAEPATPPDPPAEPLAVEPLPPRETVAPPVQQAPEMEVVPDDDGPELHYEITLFGVALFNTAPTTAGGLGLGLGLRIGPVFSFGLEGRFDIPASADLSGGGRAETSITMGGLYACARIPWVGGTAVGGCVVGGAGVLRASGHDLAQAANASTPYATVGARVFGEFVLDPIVFQLRFDVLPALVRTSLRVSDETVWALPAQSFALGGGVSAIF